MRLLLITLILVGCAAPIAVREQQSVEPTTPAPSFALSSPGAPPTGPTTSVPPAPPTVRPFTVQDRTAAGVPAFPANIGTRYSDQVDRSNASVYRYEAHARGLEVFVEREGVLSQDEERQRADWCFDAWLKLWEVFGGFAFPTYECVISDRLVPVGTAPSGLGTWSRFPARALVPSFGEVSWKSLIAHEIVHSWNFGHIGIDELWFAEGMSEYYRWLITDFDGAGQKVGEYYRSYVQQRVRGEDRPLATVTRQQDAGVAYFKGMLVFHMLDVEISERSNGSKSLDHALRRLYREVATKGIPPGTRPPPLPRSLFREAVVAEIGAGDDVDRFFADYVEGIRDLGEWRDGRLRSAVAKISPHPPVPYSLP